MFGRFAYKTIKQTMVTPVYGHFFAIIGSSVVQNHAFNIWHEQHMANAIEPSHAPESTKIAPRSKKEQLSL